MVAKEGIFASITTIGNNLWREKIKEADEIGLKEVALFLTCLQKPERRELYSLLRQSAIKRVPFAHLRNDMEPDELDFLIKKYQTQVFNIHCQAQYPWLFDLSKYKDRIYLENTYYVFEKKEMAVLAGICLDISHLESDRILGLERFKAIEKMLEVYPIGCNHISGVQKEAHFDKKGCKDYASHSLKDFTELDYLKNYPAKYFSNFIALELENDLKTQLKARDYILNLLERR